MGKWTITQEAVRDMGNAMWSNLDMRGVQYDHQRAVYEWATSNIKSEMQSAIISSYGSYTETKSQPETPKTEVEMLDERVRGVCQRGRL